MSKLPLVIIIDNVRSAYNVGSIWRTADAVGAERVILTGISPYPPLPDDDRLPHIAANAGRSIAKTALGAELSVPFTHYPNISTAITRLQSQNYTVCALEQSSTSINLFDFQPIFPLALIVGHETYGINSSVLSLVDHTLEIPQFGQKESLNVAVACGIAAFYLRTNMH